MEPKVNNKAMEVWLQELDTKSEHTKEVYLLYFNKFLERWGISDAEELYEMRRADLVSDDTRDHQNIERMVRTFMAEMHNDGYAAGSCRQVSKAVGSFMESQGRTLELNLKAKDKPQGAYNGQRLALVEHIQVMWDYAPTETKQKTRAKLMFLKDSGIRISDLANLNMSDWMEAETREVNGEGFKIFWPKETEKMAEVAYIHIGPEAVGAVEDYLKVREEWKPRPENEDDPEPLFLNRFGRRFDASSIGMVFLRIGKRIGRKLSAHSLRKFHKTTLEGAGVAEQWIKKLQGKAADVYSRPEESGELTKAYIEAYDSLRVFGVEASAQKVQEQSDRIADLERKNLDLKAQLEAELKKRDGATEQYEEQTTRLEGLVEHLIERIEKLEEK